MSITFNALLTTKTGGEISTTLVDFDAADLMPGDVSVAIDYSTVNYKDAMAISGQAPIIRQFPLIPALTFQGSSSPRRTQGSTLVIVLSPTVGA